MFISVPSPWGAVSLTLFNVNVGGRTLRQIERSTRRRPLTRQVGRPDGDDVVLNTSAGGFETDDDGNLHVTIADEFLDEYTAPGGALQSVVKTSEIRIVFTADVGYLLVLAGKSKAAPIATKVSQLAFRDQDDPISRCTIQPERLGDFIRDHDAQIMSCSWRELDIPSLSGANLNGNEIEGSQDFQRYDRHGSKYSVRVRLPALGMTLSINREASVHFFTGHELGEQGSYAQCS